MLGIKEIEIDHEMETAYCRNALLHRQLSIEMKNPSFEPRTFISIQIHLASTSNYWFLARINCLSGLIISPCEEINKL